MPFPVATLGAVTNVEPPAPGPGGVIAGVPTVLVGGLPVATVGSPLNPHNTTKYNPQCAKATIAVGNPTVLVMGKPIAMVGSLCTCGHKILVPVNPTVLVGK